MNIVISENASALGKAAGEAAAACLQRVIAANGYARIVVSTGSSQFETLETLTAADVDWTKVEMFHLDEYVGLPETHIASFRRYLRERLVSKVSFMGYYFVDGDPAHIPALTAKLREKPVDLGLIGIGVNGHIAFNDPPADFNTDEAYITVTLDETCRNQQVGEGWFAGIDEVPAHAISMTPREIMKCKTIISAVPHAVKAKAVRDTLREPVSPAVPATLLRTHPDWSLFIDRGSAQLVNGDE